MTSLFPHPPYAEDQPLARTILTSHVLLRGFTTGPVLAMLPLTISLLRQPLTALSPTTRLLHASAAGAAWGTGISAVALVGRMWGRDQVEWQDRSWRLLANDGQVECDWWCLGGAGVGAAVATSTTSAGRGKNVVMPGLAGAGARAGAARVLLGGAGLGSIVGTVGYMVCRYGMGMGRAARAEREGKV